MIQILTSKVIDIESIIFEEVKRRYATPYDNNVFIKHFTYKPNTKTGSIKDFVERMRGLNKIDPTLYKIPDPLEVINLILTRPTYYLNLSGTIKTQSKAELYEYAHVVAMKGLIIDRDVYLSSLYATCSQLLTYKRFEFYKDDISIKEYKDLIQRMYVEPHFKEFLENQPHNIALRADIEYTRRILKTMVPHLYDYYDKKYYNISDILRLLTRTSGASAYDCLIRKICSSARKKCKTIIGEVGFYELSTKPLCIFDADKLDEIVKIEFPKYRLFLDSVYQHMERTLQNIIFVSKGNEVSLDLADLELFTDKQLIILHEFKRIALTYIVMYQYLVKILGS